MIVSYHFTTLMHVVNGGGLMNMDNFVDYHGGFTSFSGFDGEDVIESQMSQKIVLNQIPQSRLTPTTTARRSGFTPPTQLTYIPVTRRPTQPTTTIVITKPETQQSIFITDDSEPTSSSDSQQPPAWCTTFTQAARNTPELSILVEALAITNLADVLDDAELQATVLVPSNNAFRRLFDRLGTEMQTFLADPQLSDIMSYHVIPEVVLLTEDFQDNQQLPTLLGKFLTVDLNDRISFRGFASNGTVVTENSQLCNIVAHVVDFVLLPDYM
eukprot:TRINITY_DN6720_c0_g2_i1.p2 TRINITY_DN6720_c0_g2~~TRINITY_DN6720_c0_g2_i1.p2  ORF type:complete len:307 (+),score=20.30 TRINITY_DN6720_c0_g2_i1:114-923(+)